MILNIHITNKPKLLLNIRLLFCQKTPTKKKLDIAPRANTLPFFCILRTKIRIFFKMLIHYSRSSHRCVGRPTGILRVSLPSFVSFHRRWFIAQIISFFQLSEIGWWIESLIASKYSEVSKTNSNDQKIMKVEISNSTQ